MFLVIFIKKYQMDYVWLALKECCLIQIYFLIVIFTLKKIYIPKLLKDLKLAVVSFFFI